MCVMAADVLLIVHFLYVLCIVLPVPLILIGGLRRWPFVRNPWFRNIHLGMVGIVIVQTLFGLFCPLTTWEQNLRRSVGEGTYYEKSFIEHWVGRMLYYDFPPWVFATVYLVFGCFVIALYFLIPPRRKF